MPADPMAPRGVDPSGRSGTNEASRARADLEMIASAAAHDLREPLQVIRLFAAVIDRSTPAGEQASRAIRDAADHMARMVDAVRALARAPDRSVGTCRLSDVATALAGLAGGEARVELTADGEIPLHPDHLRDVLEPLVRNALTFVRAGSPAVVRLSVHPGPPLRVLVDDEGPGIPPADRERLFGLFARLERDRAVPGAGAGLTMARRAATLGGALLQIGATETGGTRVELVFPPPAAGRSGS